ncbi:MAG: CvpA family protein [Treponema sp.]|nr:CvpA family protein [Treponema sp.]
MSVVDLVMIGIIALFGIITAIKGFSKEIFAQAAWILGVICAVIFYKTLFPFVYDIIKISSLAMILAFIVIFIGVFLIVKIVGHLISKIFSGEILGSLDHTLGFVLGIIEGFIIVLVLVFLLECQPWFDVSPLFEGSFLMEHIFSKIIPTLNELIKESEEKLQAQEASKAAVIFNLSGAVA